MKINGIAGSAGVYGPNGPRKAGGKRSEQLKQTDRVTVSPEAREAAGLRAKLDATPDVRAERVEALQQQIDAGTYRPSGRDVAARMLQAKVFDDMA